MPKRLDNNIRNKAENDLLEFVLDRHLNGQPGMPAKARNASEVDLLKLSKLSGISRYRISLILPHIEHLKEVYGLETSVITRPYRAKVIPDGLAAGDKVRSFYENRPLPSRLRIAREVGLTQKEIRSALCHKLITELYKENGRIWGVQHPAEETSAINAYAARLRSEGKKLPRLRGSRQLDRVTISAETGIPVGRLRSRCLKGMLEQIDPVETRATAAEMRVHIESLSVYIDKKVADGISIPKYGKGFNLHSIANDVGITTVKLHNNKEMRALIRKWASQL